MSTLVIFCSKLADALLSGGEDTGGFDDVLGADGTPFDVGGIALLEHDDGLALDPKLAVLGFDPSLVAPVNRVVLEHVHLQSRTRVTSRRLIRIGGNSVPCTQGR